MATADPYGLTASGIPLELQAEYRGLTRQQAIQEALMKQGMAPGGDAINAGKFMVRRSPLEGLAKIVQAYMGQKGLADTDAKFGELGKRASDLTAQEVQSYMQRKNGTPERLEIPMPPYEVGGGPGREAMPAVAGDPRAAVTQAMLSRNPTLQKLATMDYATMTKQPEKIDAGDRWILMRDGVKVGEVPKSATPDAIVRESGAAARHITPSGSTVASQAGQNARFAGVSGNTAAQINAQANLRAAQEAAARAQAGAVPVNAAASAANANYNTGSNIPSPVLPNAAPASAVPPAQPGSAGTSWNGAPLRTEADARVAATPNAIPQGPAVPPGVDPAVALFNGQPGMPAAPASPRARDQAIIEGNRAAATRDNRPPSDETQRAILDADQAVLATQQVAGYLKQARDLNEKAMGFPGAGAVATAGSFLPSQVRPAAVNDTQVLDNVVTTSVLPQLKLVFGGNPTEGERKILLDVAGSSSKNPAVRKAIFDNAEKAAADRLKFNTDRAQKLRSGTYFTVNGGTPTPASSVPAAPTAPAQKPRIVDW